MNHLKVVFWNGEGGFEDAVLSSVGSGKIAFLMEGGTMWEMQGDGTDVNYTLTDKTGGHGPLIYSMEWVN